MPGSGSESELIDEGPVVVTLTTRTLLAVVAVLFVALGLTFVVRAALPLARDRPAAIRVRGVAASATARVGWIAAVAVLLAAILTQRPWVPLEKIETDDGAITRYILGVGSGYRNVLKGDHEFVIPVSSDVVSRT